MYNPTDYWQSRGKDYHHVESDDELEFLKLFLDDNSFKSILEVGSGDGRVYSYLKTSIPYRMVDFVDSFRTACFDKTKILPDKWNGHHLPYEDNSFDCVISFSVLLHVPFGDIRRFLKEHMRVTKKYLVIATCDSGSDYGIDEGHCFRHDYVSLFEELRFTVTDIIVPRNKLRRLFILRKV